ncbi:UDP-N-acetylmuramoyl-tripeptide--D-alanyl-D-alanine ligase [Campylobacter majalis]|uniref:UDP-N-acetylmuramoyl-tripeptide--D-alanyl-D-alanine ligase n=1 Tax=Campylobacter majalis TaxID=2790656 RepID=A0ABN7K5V0_9BACT|nr:UDP-N-acetylmuramoyl-tripeptide--D-alanyl-D-alanine ligase [Campylobacter majalis]CAD7286808.1 UDP-N-acetylmuramoyl-tripeptide--D-alanyl-D-alanine ligase [Campylobacter majalis]
MKELVSLVYPHFLAFSALFFAFALSFYIITCFQWFSYRLNRVIFHFTRPSWHVMFVILPVVLYYTTREFFYIYFYFAYLPSLYLWHKKLDKKLVFTARIKRFFLILFFALISYYAIYYFKFNSYAGNIILPIFISLILSHLYEKFLALSYKNRAKRKLESCKNLVIILITASYGKTSIKNFIYELIKDDFIAYKTPRSVNTLVGLIKDINENITPDTQIYVAEAGARLRGDIDEISTFLNPQIVVVGEIGEQHLEYFKSMQNIKNTKLEALNSNRLKVAFLHSTTEVVQSKERVIYDACLSDVVSDLSGLRFNLDGKNYQSPILGKFNAQNLAVAIKVAHYLKINDDKIAINLSKMQNVEHRLVRMDAGGKVIIDDSFNGNFAGMSASYELVSTYAGRKVLVTPGIVEANESLNENLSKIINEVFDVVIITSSLNAQSLLKYLNKPQILILKDKNNMQQMLIEHTKVGDLILFSNDAPSFM